MFARSFDQVIDENAPISPVPELFCGDFEDCVPENVIGLSDSPVFRGLAAQSNGDIHQTLPSNPAEAFSLYRPRNFMNGPSKSRLIREQASWHLRLDQGTNTQFSEQQQDTGYISGVMSTIEPDSDFSVIDQMTRSPEFLHAVGGVQASSRFKHLSRHGILPFDRTAVNLTDEGFVNASFIQGSDGMSKRYIASEAPLSGRIPAFLKMICEHSVSTMVSLVDGCSDRCSDGCRHECSAYWPKHVGQTRSFGEMAVTLEDESQDGSVVSRLLSISQRLVPFKYYVKQFQLRGWKDMSGASDVIAMEKLMRILSKEDPTSPLLVHCSAGIGRTGVFIAVHKALELDCSPISLPHLVIAMRCDRPCMVYTKGQYESVSAVVERLRGPVCATV